MTPQPILDFLHTLPPIISKAPPVIGVSGQAQVKILYLLDRTLKNIFIDPQLLQSPLDLHVRVLEAIEDAQQFRERQIQAIISRQIRIANLSSWDVEGILLAVKSRQTAVSLGVQGIGKNHLVLVVRGQRGEINNLLFKSMRLNDSKELERSIVEAARQGHERIKDMQKTWPFPELTLI
jgi:DNA-binding protein YbaB